MDKFSFKCRNCGFLEDSGNAGERHLPAACRNCNAGVHFDPVSGIKEYDDDNWIVLSDLSGHELEEVLAFHGLDKKQIEPHKAAPSTSNREPQNISREVADGLGAEDHP